MNKISPLALCISLLCAPLILSGCGSSDYGRNMLDSLQALEAVYEANRDTPENLPAALDGYIEQWAPVWTSVHETNRTQRESVSDRAFAVYEGRLRDAAHRIVDLDFDWRSRVSSNPQLIAEYVRRLAVIGRDIR